MRWVSNILPRGVILIVAIWVGRLAWATDPSDAEREKARACHQKNAALRPDFDKAVAAHSTCKQSSDCVVLTPGCPFGCYVAVARTDAAEVERLAHELASRIGSDCRCMYKCSAAPRASCAGGRCTIPSPR